MPPPPLQEEKLRYRSASDHTLVGILTHPTEASATCSAGTSPAPCVLLLHGGMANKNSFYHPALAARLAADGGRHVFRYDGTGNGESGPIWAEQDAGGSSWAASSSSSSPEPPEQYRNMMSVSTGRTPESLTCSCSSDLCHAHHNDRLLFRREFHIALGVAAGFLGGCRRRTPHSTYCTEDLLLAHTYIGLHASAQATAGGVVVY
eukprot:COSAG01_NODE_8437_length_2785_cov_4.217424_4_plen_205_part_00